MRDKLKQNSKRISFACLVFTHRQIEKQVGYPLYSQMINICYHNIPFIMQPIDMISDMVYQLESWYDLKKSKSILPAVM